MARPKDAARRSPGGDWVTGAAGLAMLLTACASSHWLLPRLAAIGAPWLHLHVLEAVPLLPLLLAVAAAAYAAAWVFRPRQRTLLLDFACYKPEEKYKVSQQWYHDQSTGFGVYTPDAVAFQTKILRRNGLGEETYMPPCLHEPALHASMLSAREETHMVLAGCVQDVLTKTGLRPQDIDFLVVNCSVFTPTPSISAMVVNHFHMRSDVLTYNLGGMGCSAGVIALGLAQRLLRTQPNSYALVLSTENITQGIYQGSDRSMLLSNTLFRMGGAALVLTNRAGEARRAKFELEHVVRVHLGSSDEAYRCVYQHEDREGVVGVELNKDLVRVAGKALERNLTKLGPLVLPLGEKLRYALRGLQRMLLGAEGRPAYVPDFKKAFTHFCLHTGGRAVIEGLGKQLGLSAAQVQPSFNALYWYGNTSSASVWYGLAYIEACQGIRKGERVWQVAFGSGFKCNSAVWRALRTFRDGRHVAWAHLQGDTPLAEQRRGAWWRYLQEQGTPGSYGREHEAPVRRASVAPPLEAPLAVAAAPKGPAVPTPPAAGKHAPTFGVHASSSPLHGTISAQTQSMICR